MTICPECGSDQVVQLAGQPGPYSSTPINNSSIEDSDMNLTINQSLQEVSKALLTFIDPLPSNPFVENTFVCHCHYSFRMKEQMLALVVALFLKPAPLQKIPLSSLPREAPSSSEMLRVTSQASPPMQTARVKTACSGATATPPQVLHRPSSTLHLLGDPLHTVSLSDDSKV